MNHRIALMTGTAALALLAAAPGAAQTAPKSTTKAAPQTAPTTTTTTATQTDSDAASTAPTSVTENKTGQAATAPASPDSVAPSAGDIVVTGSRIRSGTFSSPTPVTSISQSDLVAAAPATLADGLRQLPSITPTGGQTAGGGTANGGQNFLNLRALGTSRTLVLVDSRRFTPSGPTNLIDVNLIPQGLVDRVDVVTGGASAAYGSDAVAGVVNFVLNKRYVGLKADVSVGISQRGDNAEQKVALTYGFKALDDRLHFVASGEYFKSAGVNGDERSFRTTAPNQLVNPFGTPKLVRGNDLRTPFTTGGLVVLGQGGSAAANSQISGSMFAPNGTPQPYSYGTLASDVGSTSGSQNGGDGFRVSTGQEIVRPLERKTAFGHLEFEVTNDLVVYAEGLYGHTLSQFQSSPTTSTITIQSTNPYLAQVAPGLVAQMNRLGVPRFLLNRLTLERGLTIQDNENETLQGTIGASGKFGGNWRWYAAYQYGRNRNDNPLSNNLITGNLTRAANAVVANGQIVCADTISANAATRAAAAGCQPFNPFGSGAPSSASLDYVFGTSTFRTITTQQTADVNISGSLFDLPAGAVSVAAGGEYRRIVADTVADPLSIAGAYRLVNQQNFSGAYDIKEIYGEIQVPIFKNSRFGQSFDIDLAGRHTDYSTSGGVNTWKAGAVWQLTDWLRLRGTRSRDIRAPNLQELFATGRQNNITIDDTLRTGRTYLSVPNLTFGNRDLKPEVAQTTVIGAVVRPEFIRGLNIAVDFYNIKIANAITNVGGNDAVNQCNRSGQTSSLCASVIRDPATQAVIQTTTQPYNLAQQQAKGVDIETTYRVPLNRIFGGNPGNLDVRVVAGYVAKNLTTSPLLTVVYDNAGQATNNGGAISLPHWRGTTTFNYKIGVFSAFTQVRYIGPMTWDKSKILGVDTDFNHVKAAAYVDAQFSLTIPSFGHDQQVFINIQNLLDRRPNYDPITGGATPLPTDPNLYDQVGRMLRAGFKARF